MPYLDLVHVRERRCAQCGALLAPPGARSFILGSDGLPVEFSADDPPERLGVTLRCEHGHETILSVPDDVSAEPALLTPDDAPIGADATLSKTT